MKLPILTYHSLDESGSAVSVDPRSFRRQVETLGRAGYRGRSLRGCLAGAASDDPDPKLVALTFDDGYLNLLQVAAPILAEHGWTGTVFPVAGYVGRTNRWPTQPPAIPEAALLDWSDLRELAAAGWEVGAHSLTHPDLTASDDLTRELFDAAALLEDRVGHAVTSFAYPYGAYDGRVRDAVRQRFAASCTTRMAIAETADDHATLPRLDMWYFSRAGAHRLLAPPWLAPYVAFCRAARLGSSATRNVRQKARRRLVDPVTPLPSSHPRFTSRQRP